MERDHLKIFYEQEQVRESVKQYCLDTLDEHVLKQAYAEGDVAGYKQARAVILGVFSRLNEMYAKESNNNKDNKAR